MALMTFCQVRDAIREFREAAGLDAAIELLRQVGLKKVYELKKCSPEQINAFGLLVTRRHGLFLTAKRTEELFQEKPAPSMTIKTDAEGHISGIHITEAAISGLFPGSKIVLAENPSFAELTGRMASVQKVISKIQRWGLDSVEPREGHPDHGNSNRQIMLRQLDALRARIGVAEDALARDMLRVDRQLASDLELALTDLKNLKGVQTVLSVMREIGGTDDMAKLLSDPVRARAVAERACALVLAHYGAATPKKPASPLEDDSDDGYD